MPTYLYGLILRDNAARVPRAVTGIEGEPIRVLDGGLLAALVGTVARIPDSTLDAVKSHDAVLQSLVDAGVTAAAARFRQTFVDDADASRDVEEQADRVARFLRDFEGCVEMRLLLRHAEAAESPAAVTDRTASPGRDYLEQLRMEHAPATHLALAGMLGPTVRGERVSLLPRDRGVVFAHLVDRSRLGEYRDAVASYPALADAVMVGPLALYSFAEPQP